MMCSMARVTWETWWENTEDTTLWGEVDDFEEEAKLFSPAG